MKILHTVIDWWLSESTINMFKSLPVENEFVFLRNEDGEYDFKVLKSVDDVRVVKIGSLEYKELLKPGKYNLLWVHGLYPTSASLVRDFPREVKVMWTSWGFDYLRFDVQWLYAPKTTLYWLRTAPKREILKCLLQWSLNKVGLLNAAYRIFRKDNLFFQFFKRVDYFSTVIPTEEPYIRRVLGTKPKKVLFHCASPRLKEREYPLADLSVKRILLGNSADVTCNHLDILPLAAAIGYETWSPLSYSRTTGINVPPYAEHVIRAGKRMMGDRFYPILEMLSANDYIKLVASCPICIFDHYRQQGQGSSNTALKCGCCLFLNPKNPAYKYYLDNGIIVYPIDRLKSGVADVLEEFRPHQKENAKAATALVGIDRLLTEISDTVRSLRMEICGER